MNLATVRTLSLVNMLQMGLHQEEGQPQCHVSDVTGDCLRPLGGSLDESKRLKLQEFTRPLQQKYAEKGVKDFYIVLDRTTYVPGDRVMGKMVLHIVNDMEGDTFSLRIRGQGQSVFKFVDDRKIVQEVVGVATYVRDRRSVWGETVRTAILRNSGRCARFGPPWSPTEGDLYLSVDGPETIVNIRVVDYDRGRPDDILGQTFRKARELVTTGEELTLELWRREGKPGGNVSLRGKWVDASEVLAANLTHNGEKVMDPHKKHLKLTIIATWDLVNRDELFIGRNDVYVEADANTTESYGFNRSECGRGRLDESSWFRRLFGMYSVCRRPFEPKRNLTKGYYELPFSFALPNELPSSYEASSNEARGNFIRYSVVAEIGGDNDGRKYDGFATRTLFTVVPAEQPRVVDVPVHASNGQVSVKLDRSEYAPKERLELTGEINNGDEPSRYIMRIATRVYCSGENQNAVTEGDFFTYQRVRGQFVGRTTKLWEKELDSHESLDLASIKNVIAPVPAWASTHWPGVFREIPQGAWGHRFDGFLEKHELETFDATRWRYDLEIIRESIPTSWIQSCLQWVQSRLFGPQQEKVLRMPIVITSYRDPNMTLDEADEEVDLLERSMTLAEDSLKINTVHFEGNRYYRATTETLQTRQSSSLPLSGILRVTIDSSFYDGSSYDERLRRKPLDDGGSFVTCELQGKVEKFYTKVREVTKTYDTDKAERFAWLETFEFYEYTLGDTIMFHAWHQYPDGENHSLGEAFLASRDFAPQGLFNGSIPIEMFGAMRRLSVLMVAAQVLPFNT